MTSLLDLAMASRLPNSPRCALPTLSSTPIVGEVMPHRYAMCPTPRAPISSTRVRVDSSASSTVSGSPTSVLNDPAGATTGPRCATTAAIKSFVLVFPEEPVTATTSRWGRRSITARASDPSASTESSTTIVGTPVGRSPSTPAAPAAAASAAKSCPSTRSPTMATYSCPGWISRESAAAPVISGSVGDGSCRTPPTMRATSDSVSAIMIGPTVPRRAAGLPEEPRSDHRTD